MLRTRQEFVEVGDRYGLFRSEDLRTRDNEITADLCKLSANFLKLKSRKYLRHVAL